MYDAITIFVILSETKGLVLDLRTGSVRDLRFFGFGLRMTTKKRR